MTKPILPILILLILHVNALEVTLASKSHCTNEGEILLTFKPWKFDGKVEAKSNKGNWFNITSQNLPCIADNRLTFGIDNTYQIWSGKLLCKGESKIVRSGTWLFRANNGNLIMDDYELEVKILNRDTLQLIRKSGSDRERHTYSLNKKKLRSKAALLTI